MKTANIVEKVIGYGNGSVEFITKSGLHVHAFADGGLVCKRLCDAEEVDAADDVIDVARRLLAAKRTIDVFAPRGRVMSGPGVDR